MINNNICIYHMPFNKYDKIIEFSINNSSKDANIIYDKEGFSLIPVIDRNGVYNLPSSKDIAIFFGKNKMHFKTASIDTTMDHYMNNNDIMTAITTRQNRNCYNESAFMYAKTFNDEMIEIVTKDKHL